VLAGGVVRHRSRLLVDGIVERVAASAPEARPLVAELPPAAGALRLALRDAGVAADERVSERMRASLVPRAGVLNVIRAPT
jgi:hypothetical protein